MNFNIFRQTKSPLLLEGWIEFNKRKWGLDAKSIEWAPDGKDFPNVTTCFYLNKKGKLVLPPLNPYLGIEVATTNTNTKYNIISQWQKIAYYLVGEMKNHGLGSMVMLPPGITDCRPWNWDRFSTGVKYTYTLDFPYAISEAKGEHRTYIKKAIKRGYVAVRSTNMKDVYDCLLAVEERKSFSHQLTLEDLELMSSLLGEEHFRAYICYAPNGEVASAVINLYCDDGYTIGLAMGTKEEHLTSGSAVYLDQVVLDDIQETRAKGIDFCGANIPSVAKAKRNWGANLVPFYSIEEHGLFTIAKNIRNWYLFKRNN